MKKGILLISLALLFCFGGLRVPPVYAVLFGFSNITNNSLIDAEIGESQLSVEVTDPSGGEDPNANQALFTFFNTGPDACSITDIYFDNYFPLVLSEIAYINDDDPGVSFSEGASPPKLPGGDTLTFPFATVFSASSDPEAQPNGVNPGESVGILFDLLGSKTLADVLFALQDLREYPIMTLRIGIHVQGFDGEGSESFVNDPTPRPPRSVPEPSTMLLLGVGLIGLAGIGRKKFVKK